MTRFYPRTESSDCVYMTWRAIGLADIVATSYVAIHSTHDTTSRNASNDVSWVSIYGVPQPHWNHTYANHSSTCQLSQLSCACYGFVPESIETPPLGTRKMLKLRQHRIQRCTSNLLKLIHHRAGTHCVPRTMLELRHHGNRPVRCPDRGRAAESAATGLAAGPSGQSDKT
jgi:hypothetical protein